MATINLTAFLSLVTPYAPGVAQVTATQAIRKAAIEFCEETRIWRHTSTNPINRQHYPIRHPVYATIHEIERAEFNGVPLMPERYDAFDLKDFEDMAQPRHFTQREPGSICILPFEAGTLVCTLILKPINAELYDIDGQDRPQNYYDTVPDYLMSQHGEAIAAGALARLLMMPKQEFTNPQLAQAFGMQFRAAIDRSKYTNVTGQQRAKRRTVASWF